MREANKLQGTGAWFNDRTGKLTASRLSAARAFLKQTKEEKEKNKPPREAAERRKLKIEILCERMTDNIVSKYVTAEMQWGIDQEPIAKEFVTAKTGWTIRDLPFIDHPTIDNCGASPDGYIEEENALIEVKCPSSATMVSWLLAAQEDKLWVPDEHVDQMILQSACMGGIPVWFAAFDPRLPDNQKLLLRKFTPTDEEILKAEQDAKVFLVEIEEMFQKLTTGV
jgi:hypothetical protein